MTSEKKKVEQENHTEISEVKDGSSVSIGDNTTTHIYNVDIKVISVRIILSLSILVASVAVYRWVDSSQPPSKPQTPSEVNTESDTTVVSSHQNYVLEIGKSTRVEDYGLTVYGEKFQIGTEKMYTLYISIDNQDQIPFPVLAVGQTQFIELHQKVYRLEILNIDFALDHIEFLMVCDKSC